MFKPADPASEIEMPTKRGVVIYEGEVLKRILGEPRHYLKNSPGIERCLEFFRDRGMEQVKSVGSFDDKEKRNIAVMIVWTKEATLEQSLKSLREKFTDDTPKLVIYCGEENQPEAFQDDVRLLEGQREIFDNHFVLHMIGHNLDIQPFLEDIISIISDEEYKRCPNEYECVSKILTWDMFPNSIRLTILSGLHEESSLRIEGLPFQQCLMKNDPKMKEALARPPPAKAVVDKGAEKNAYENKLDGKVLIISNEKFPNKILRRSARLDVENLLFLFKTVLQYKNVKVERNVDAGKMIDTIKEHFPDNNCGSFGILVVLTHGNSSHLLGTDGQKVATRNLLDTFASLKGLAKLPKLAIIDACRVYTVNASPVINQECYDVTTDRVADMAREFGQWHLGSETATAEENSPDRAGLIIAFSTSPGESSLRFPISGSRFIGSLCWVFCMKAGTLDVVSMIADVNYLMTHIKNEPNYPGAVITSPLGKQIPAWTVQTTMKFYLTKTEMDIPISEEPYDES